MSDSEILRRASYGPSSPVVGERGARTRQAIVDAALDCFAEKGFHATLVDDIASAVGISRAGLYQYFASKEQLFIELLHESGGALLRVVRRVGQLGPTAEGYDNLHWWLGEWAWVYDKYRTMFVQWATVDSPDAPLRPLIAQFNDSYTARVSSRLNASGVQGLDPDDVAVALLAVLVRFNHYRHTPASRGATDEVMLDTLAAFVQMALFPSTPPEALVLGGHAAAVDGAAPRSPSGGDGRRPRPPRVRPRRAERPRFEGSSERVLATVRKLLDAGSSVFAARGYHASSVDEILREAGLGRGTFYKYLNDKLDLLLTLAEECADQFEDRLVSFATAVHDESGAALRDWLLEYVAFHRRYAGVFRAWSEGDPHDELLTRIGLDVGGAILRAFDEVLGSVERPFPFHVRSGSLILMSLLERVPDYAVGTAYSMPAERVAEVTAALIERGLLGRVSRA